MKTLISKVEFHRNGTSANGFYFVECWQGGSPFWATFESTDEPEKILPTTIRVLSPNKPYRRWRGEMFIRDIELRLDYLKNKFKTAIWYDLIGRKLDCPKGFYDVFCEPCGKCGLEELKTALQPDLR